MGTCRKNKKQPSFQPAPLYLGAQQHLPQEYQYSAQVKRFEDKISTELKSFHSTFAAHSCLIMSTMWPSSFDLFESYPTIFTNLSVQDAAAAAGRFSAQDLASARYGRGGAGLPASLGEAEQPRDPFQGSYYVHSEIRNTIEKPMIQWHSSEFHYVGWSLLKETDNFYIS